MKITAGATNRSVYFYVQQDNGAAAPGEPHTGMLFSDLDSASYMRQGAARVAITPITLASASAAHDDGGFILVDDTNIPGVYRLDVPDAAFLTGVDQVVVSIVPAGGQNAVSTPQMIDLLTAEEMNAFADSFLRRTFANMEASAFGDTIDFRSLAGAIAKLVNKIAISGSTLTIYLDDDTTALGTQALTTNAAAIPITALDTN